MTEKNAIDILKPLVGFDTTSYKELIDLRIKYQSGYFKFLIPRDRVTSSSARLFALWITLPAILVIFIAILFLKNQTRPITKLAEASERFGRGEDVEEYRPSGALEIRKAGYEFDATGISPIEGSTLPSDDATEGEGEEFQYKQLLQESEFGLGEDKRSDYIDMLDTQDIYSSDMIGNMRTALDNIRSDEEDARQTYREASTGGGGYSDMLSELMSTFERGTSELNVDKESALKDLLQEYKTGAVEQRDIYTEDIGESIEAEKGLQASTGLEREDKSISDIVKGYMPDFEKQLESYQLATGATTEDIMGSYGTIKKDWREDVLDEEKKVEDAWGTLQESVYDPHMGQDLLTGLLSGEGGYYDSLKKEMDSWGTTSDVWNWME